MMYAELRAAEFGLLNEERQGDLFRAALASALPRTLRRLRSLTGLSLRGPLPRSALAPLAEADVAPLAAAVARVYAANLRAVRALAREHGFAALFVRQPFVATKEVKSADELAHEASLTLDVGLRRRLAAAVGEACRRHPDVEGSADVLDLSTLFDKETRPVYVNLCHLSESANATIAEAMLPAIEAALQRAADASQRNPIESQGKAATTASATSSAAK